jgi:hypothetical protein
LIFTSEYFGYFCNLREYLAVLVNLILAAAVLDFSFYFVSPIERQLHKSDDIDVQLYALWSKVLRE